ncbi:MAG: hypothetical protein WCY32_05450 [Burkholderiaceae bacterium]
MTISILCAGALALPGGSDEARRASLLDRHAPPADGPAARLLARARAPQHTRDATLTPRELPDEHWLREHFGLDSDATVAACAALAADEGAVRGDGLLGDSLLVRPVHLHVGLDHLVLAVPQAADIDADEAAALADSANSLFAADGLAWRALSPHAWLLQATGPAGRPRLAALASLQCRSARLAAGRDIDTWQPVGEAAGAWRSLVNELQMLWFEHPVNEARAAAGRPTLNSLWLEGRPGTAHRRPFDAAITADDAVAGLALSAGCEVSALPVSASADDFIRLVMIQENVESILVDPGWWRSAAMTADAEAWRDGWQQLDLLLERLQAAGMPVDEVVLTGERDRLAFALRPADRWAFWRKRPLMHWLAGYR